MVKKDTVKAVGKAHPLNNSNLLTDYAYVLRVGTHTNTVTINREVGCQRIHGNNYGRNNQELMTLKPALVGVYREIAKSAQKYNCMDALEKFLRNWTIEHLLSILRFRRIKFLPEDKGFFINLYQDTMRDLPYFSKGFPMFALRVYFPDIADAYLKNKWIFEARTIKKGVKKIIFKQ